MRAMTHTHTRVAGMEKRKPLTVLPASRRAQPPCIGPKTAAAMRQQRCCGSTGQPNRRPACLMAASTPDRCRRR